MSDTELEADVIASGWIAAKFAERKESCSVDVYSSFSDPPHGETASLI